VEWRCTKLATPLVSKAQQQRRAPRTQARRPTSQYLLPSPLRPCVSAFNPLPSALPTTRLLLHRRDRNRRQHCSAIFLHEILHDVFHPFSEIAQVMNGNRLHHRCLGAVLHFDDDILHRVMDGSLTELLVDPANDRGFHGTRRGPRPCDQSPVPCETKPDCSRPRPGGLLPGRGLVRLHLSAFTSGSSLALASPARSEPLQDRLQRW